MTDDADAVTPSSNTRSYTCTIVPRMVIFELLLQFQNFLHRVSGVETPSLKIISLLEGLAQSSLWWVLTAGKKGGWLMLTTAILAWGLQGSV